MNQVLDQIYSKDERHLAAVADESRDVVVLSTGFDPAGKTAAHPPRDLHLTAASEKLLAESVRVLRVGGWMFVYGLPEELPYWARHLSEIVRENKPPGFPSPGLTATLPPSEGERDLVRGVPSRMVFKYWIALDLDDTPASKTLKPSHQGVLMFLKSSTDKKSPLTPHLNIDAAR